MEGKLGEKSYERREKNNNNIVCVYKKRRGKVGGLGPDRPGRGTRLSINRDHARPVSARYRLPRRHRRRRSRRRPSFFRFSRAHVQVYNNNNIIYFKVGTYRYMCIGIYIT